MADEASAVSDPAPAPRSGWAGLSGEEKVAAIVGWPMIVIIFLGIAFGVVLAVSEAFDPQPPTRSNPGTYNGSGGGDLDCADVNGPVYVGDDDPHHLDGDGDGVGCEPYP